MRASGEASWKEAPLVELATSDALSALKAGDHLCLLQDNPQHYRDFLVGLVRLAQQRRWRILYIASPQQHQQMAVWLREAGLDAGGLTSDKALVFVQREQAVVRNGAFDVEGGLEALQAQADTARREGFDVLLAVTDMKWLAEVGEPAMRRAIDFSSRLTDLAREQGFIAAEVYDRGRFDPLFLLDMMSTQPLLCTSGGLLENLYHLARAGSGGPEESAGVLEQLLQVLARRKSSEEDLRRREAHSRKLIELAGLPIFSLDDLGRVTEFNRQAEILHGCGRDEALGLDYAATFLDDRDRRRFMETLHQVIEEGAAASLECQGRKRQGQRSILLWTLTALYADSGEVIGVVAVGQDITARRRNEEHVAQAQKLETIGQLAGGIAHHFNNLLTIVMGNAELMQRSLPRESDCYHMAEQVVNAAQRAGDLTSQLLAFARKGRFKVVPVDLHDLIQRSVDLLDVTIDKRIEIRLDLQASDFMSRGDPAQLENVLLNLALNACDAMPQGGLIEISTRNASFGADDARPESLDAGHYIAIAIRDTGIGMSQETQAHIFEPFFTTKEVGKGAGLGLASVYGCVSNHGGAVTVRSAEGEGTTFEIYLPAERQEPAQPARLTARPRGRILLVDDEESVRAFGAEVLRREGYEIVTCANGAEAMRVFAENPERFDLVILDMVMPKLDGLDTFRQMKRIRPDIRAMLSSGFSINDLPREILDEGVLDFLAKPYRIEQLSQKVARVIRPPSRRAD